MASHVGLSAQLEAYPDATLDHYDGPLCQVLRHLPCSEMEFLRAPPRDSLLEPIHVNHF